MGKTKDISPWTSPAWGLPADHYMYSAQYGPRSVFPTTANIVHYMASSGLTPIQLDGNSFDLSKTHDFVIEFSTTPLSGNTVGESDRTATCDDSVGNWYRWTGIGSVTSQIDPNTITRVRIK